MAAKAPSDGDISWLATAPQFAVLAVAIAVGGVFGAGIYLAYSFGVRAFATRAHRAGIRCTRNGDFAAAIPLFEKSYRQFSEHAWVDRFRSIVLMSPSAISYREMALVNIAFSQAQLGRGAESKATYERALREFPSSAMAASALAQMPL